MTHKVTGVHCERDPLHDVDPPGLPLLCQLLGGCGGWADDDQWKYNYMSAIIFMFFLRLFRHRIHLHDDICYIRQYLHITVVDHVVPDGNSGSLAEFFRK